MGTNEVNRKRMQSGTEVTPGTGVAATRIVYTSFNSNFTKPLQDLPNFSGTYDDGGSPVYRRQPPPTFSGSALLTFDDIVLWAQVGIDNVAQGTGDSGTPEAFEWEFEPDVEDDNLASWTLEHGEPGNAYESDQFFLNSWTLRINPDSDGGWMFDWEALARTWVTTSYTAALPARRPEVIRAPGTLVWVDDNTIGSTAATGKIIDFSLACGINRHLKPFMETDGSYPANRHGRGRLTFDATMTVEFDNDTEFAKFRAGNPVERKVRIRKTGTTIHDAVTKKAELDIYGFYNAIDVNGDREGNMVATFGINCRRNLSAGHAVKLTVINDIEDAPGDEP